MLRRMGRSRSAPLLASILTAAALMLGGCGGGSDGAAGPAGPAGPTGPTGPGAVATVSATALTATQWGGLSLKGQVLSADMSKGTPIVTFKLTDANGTPVTGLAKKDASGAYANFSFGIAKLIPADPATKAPSRWVNYNVFSKTPVAGQTPALLFPEPENSGSMQDNLDGTYTYTFGIDVTKVKSYVDAGKFDAVHVKSDLDDLTYDPNLPHRVIVAAGGSMPDATTLVRASANMAYDFIPASGKATTASDPQRVIVDVASCNGCHSTLSLHTPRIPAMTDTKMCVVCHTDQVKYGSGDALPASGNTLVPAGDYAAYGATLKLMGRALPNFPNMVHKIHMGEDLYYQGYNQFGTKYNEVTYPQLKTNCVKCHDGSATAPNKTPQGDNWKLAPSRLACGACHDGINFATGQGKTLSGANDQFGHIGGAQQDDKNCALCHDATSIATVYHVTVDPTGSTDRGGYPVNTAANVPTPGLPAGMGPAIPLASQLGNLPAGVYKMNFEVKQVTVAGASGAKKINVTYRVLKDGSPVTLNPTGFLIDGVDGSPSIMVAYAVPQDGNATPADWNFVQDTGGGATVKDIRDRKNGNSQTGPDANGFYTATLGLTIPDNAAMVTASVGVAYQGFVQLNAAGYPKGIRLREPAFVIKTADGYTPRRQIVSKDKCNSCHGQLGVAPSFHSGARNNGEGCAACHSPNYSTGHGGPGDKGGGWSVSEKNIVHSIHASAKREKAFNWLAPADNPDGFKKVTYPGVLNNCEQCHVPGSYDFANAANSAAAPNLLWSTDANKDMSNPDKATLGLSPWVSLLGRGLVDYSKDNLVSSPISAACFGCHDSGAAVAHMQGNGGTLYQPVSSVSVSGTFDRSKGFTRTETCLVCHGSGRLADIKDVHNK
jgi:OmcA/MtrC family decaheme c-type cytochrome